MGISCRHYDLLVLFTNLINYTAMCFIFQVMHERATKDSELLSNRLIKLQQDFDMQLSAGEQLAQENNQKNIELRVR